MSIAKKKKRTVLYHHRLYYWYADIDEYSHPFALILSDDKKIQLRCRLYPEILIVLHEQPPQHITVPFGIDVFTSKIIIKRLTLYSDYQQTKPEIK